MILNDDHLEILRSALQRLRAGFPDAPQVESNPAEIAAISATLQRTADRLSDSLPFHSPYYIGQMLKPPHPIAHLAYALTMSLNPNNHAFDGGRVTSLMEVECISQLAQMIGWKESLGHLCGGGTMANFEGLWVARELAGGGQGVAASSQAHYTHRRLSRVLGIPFHEIPVDSSGKMDVSQLAKELESGEIGTVVATLGTTGLGTVDPLDQIVSLRKRLPFRLHVDAAYGGYFILARNLGSETQRALAAMREADSVAIDPHKHGLQPYGCGCILFRDPGAAAIYDHSSPYTYYSDAERHLGEISLECSRSGAAAAALWATMQQLPPVQGGEFATGLEKGRRAALQLVEGIVSHRLGIPILAPELDIVVWGIPADTASRSSALADRFFQAAASHGVHLALITLPRSLVESRPLVSDWDREEVRCLRACLMKPEHQEWMPELLHRLCHAAADLSAG